ncbi:hypothetical protein G9A89_008792 [Geosiphon pyriformis]|nr:hypothetical protein G9A89_008792 [Geosiphon pyriformis]
MLTQNALITRNDKSQPSKNSRTNMRLVPAPTPQSVKPFDYLTTRDFIEAQISLFRQEFKPSAKDLTTKTSARRQKIPPSVIKDVLFELNTRVRKQCLETFSHQGVGQLLNRVALVHEEYMKEELDSRIIVKGNNKLTSSNEESCHVIAYWIQSLPSEWPDDSKNPLKYDKTTLDRYSQLHKRVINLQEKYRITKQKHEHAIQQNLPSRSGPLVTEINKMRLLMPKLLMTLEKNHELLCRKKVERDLQSSGEDVEDQFPSNGAIDLVKRLQQDSMT